MILLLTVIFSYYQFVRQETAAYEQSYTLSRLLAEQTNQMLKSIQTRFLSLEVFIKHLDDNAEHDFVGAILRQQKVSEPSIMDLLLVDPKGKITDWLGSGKVPNISDRDYIQTHLISPGNRKLFIGQPQVSRVHDEQWFFGVSKAVYSDQHQLKYILVAIIDIEFIRQALSASTLPNFGSLVIARKDGYIYSRVPEHERVVGQKIADVARIAKQQKHHDKFVSPIDGEERYIGARSVGDTNIIAFASLNTAHVLHGWRQTTLWLSILSVILVSLLFAFIKNLSLQQYKLHENYRQQKEFACTDSLTGLNNRRYLQDISATEVKYAKLRNTEISLMLIDIDHFKKVNDTYSHMAGDKMLKSIADSIKTMFRRSDIFIRFGGEEFLIVLPNTGLKNAGLLADKFRQTIEQNSVSYQSKQINCTVSIGVSLWSRRESHFEMAIKQADTALYQAKLNGRNQVCYANTGFHGAPVEV